MSKISSSQNACFNRIKSEEPKKSVDEIYGILPRDKTKPYNSFEIIERLIDENFLINIKQILEKQLSLDMRE